MRVDDVRYLSSPAGAAALAEVAEKDFSARAEIASTEAARRLDPQHFRELVEVVQARRKAAGKLRDADSWLLTVESVEQATAWPVAARRAGRLAGRTVHDLTCSVGAELSELARHAELVVGSDLDPARALMAAHNVPEAYVTRSDALAPTTRTVGSHGRGDTVYVADPARRGGGRRIHDPAQLMPPLPELLDVLAGADFAVKCAPGLDFDALAHSGEVEVTSLDGGVREACLWSPGLAGGVRRRAVVLRSARGADAEWAEEITDLDPEPRAPDGGATGEHDTFVVEPDGAIVRAGLVRHWAARHGLRQLDPRIAHLTGPEIPPGHSGFAVLERHGLDVKVLRRRLRTLDAGSLEILVRGVDQDPDTLRRRLALKGSRALALVVTRVGDGAVALICEGRRHQART